MFYLSEKKNKNKTNMGWCYIIATLIGLIASKRLLG
jgi:hypothetical protein